MNIISTYKVKYLIFFLFMFILTFYSCQKSSHDEEVRVNLSKREDINSLPGETGGPLRVAVAARISPEENFFYYNKIFDYLSHKTGRKIIFKQRKSYQEVNQLLRLQELDFAFICSGAYVDAKEDFNAEILVVPQIKGKSSYHAYIIVRNDSGLARFEDLKGHDFAYTDPLSNTGCLYPRYLVKKMNLPEEMFFSRMIYTYAHDYSIQAVENKIVDAASVDSLIFDYLKVSSPQKVANLSVIKKSVPFGIPPAVVHRKIDPDLKRKLQSVFLNMGTDPQGKELLSHLDIDKFVMGQDSEYDSIRKMKAFIKE
jgi:phosphonate transport system substrate-binding protein